MFRELRLFIYLPLLIIITTTTLKFTEGNDHYRLPQSVRPELYKLKILTHINDNEGFKYNGKLLIYVKVYDDNVENITLHSKDLNIDYSSISIEKLSKDNNDDENNKENTTIITNDDDNYCCDYDAGNVNNKYNLSHSIGNIEVTPEYDYLILYPKKTLKKNEKYKIKMLFSSELNKDLNGYYRSKYIDKKTKEERWIAVTHFEPTHARQAFPCFDEPDMKAKFQIILGHDKKFTAISNMPLKKTKEIKNKLGWVWDYFEETVPMSTYLVAYSINDFGFKESKVDMKSNDTILFRTWARKDALSQCNYASDVGPKVLKFYEDYFNVKFPLPKIDQIAIPDFAAGAMENWGLITYREIALLYDEQRSSSSMKHRVATVISHELAHQWFGNLVTMKWWTDIWLNEGFATYIASLGVHHIHPEWDSYKETTVDNLLHIFKVDALKTSHPISIEIENPNEIGQIFDSISYKKGSSVLRMMHLFLGEAFQTGVTNYLKKHEYNNAEQDDLWKSLTDAAHNLQIMPDKYKVKEIMNSWTLQTGYPIVHVVRDYTTDSAVITQSRYLLDTDLVRHDFDNCWWIPLSYTTERDFYFNYTQPSHWLECHGKEVVPLKIENLANPEEWAIFNIQLSGLYRVKYDEKNWDLIINTLKSDNYSKIHILNRAQLIDDAMDLAWTGDQDYSIAMKLIEYLKLERDYIPWRAALTSLNAVNKMLKRTSQYDSFKKYVKKILLPIYNVLGGLTAPISSSDKDRLDAVKRKILIMSWSCRFDVDNCVPDAKEYFKKWQNSDNPDQDNPIPLDLRSVVYCTAIRHGDESEWDFLWQRYLLSNVASEKQTILTSLSCTKHIWIIQRYLEWCFDETSDIRKQDSISVFNSIAAEEIGYQTAKTYLFDHVDTIYKYYEPDTSRFGHLIYPLANQMNSETDLNMMKEFLNKYKKYFEKSTREVKRALETISINNQWKTRNYDNFSRQLQKFL